MRARARGHLRATWGWAACGAPAACSGAPRRRTTSSSSSSRSRARRLAAWADAEGGEGKRRGGQHPWEAVAFVFPSRLSWGDKARLPDAPATSESCGLRDRGPSDEAKDLPAGAFTAGLPVAHDAGVINTKCPTGGYGRDARARYAQGGVEAVFRAHSVRESGVAAPPVSALALGLVDQASTKEVGSGGAGLCATVTHGIGTTSGVGPKVTDAVVTSSMAWVCGLRRRDGTTPEAHHTSARRCLMALRAINVALFFPAITGPLNTGL